MEKISNPLREIIKIFIFSIIGISIFLLILIYLNHKNVENKTYLNSNHNIPQQNITKHVESYSVQPFLKSTKYFYKSIEEIRIYDRQYTPVQSYPIEYAILELDLENKIAIAYHNFIIKQEILSIDYDVYSYLFIKRKQQNNSSIGLSEEVEKNIVAAFINEGKPSDFAIITTDKGLIFIFKPKSYNNGHYSIVFAYKDLYIGNLFYIDYLSSIGFIEKMS